MFWKKDKGSSASAAESPAKVRKLSPKDLVAQEIDQIAPGNALVFKLGVTYIKPYITVVRSPEYPGKGKKFSVLQDGKDADGNPANKAGKFWDTNDAREIAGWLIDREGAVAK